MRFDILHIAQGTQRGITVSAAACPAYANYNSAHSGDISSAAGFTCRCAKHVTVHSAERRAFIEAALSYHTTRRDQYVWRMLRSPFSGVRTEVAAALERLRPATETFATALMRDRVALPADHRDALFAFARNLEAFAAAEPTEQAVDTHFPTGIPEHIRPPEGWQFIESAAPEEAAAPRTRTLHFSASSLNTYAECKRKWFYRYLCAAVEDKGSAASFYGTAFHAALEDFHTEFPVPGDVAPDLLRTKLLGYINVAFDRYSARFNSPVEVELQRRRAQRTARRYIDWTVAQSARAPFTVIGCELEAELQLDGYDFIGYIDRLDKDTSGGITVIDYKTGAIAQSAAEYLDKVRTFKDFQLPFYYWARTAAGDRVTRLALIPLKESSLDVAPVALDVVPVAGAERKRGTTTGTIGIAELERARTRMIEICAEITGGGLRHFDVTDDPDACRYCAYANACAERPYPTEDHFAR